MKTEYREVTIKQPVYIAEDGTEFTDEYECLDYEFEKLKDTFECYDTDYSKSDVDTCMFVNLPTEVIVKNFLKVSKNLDLPVHGVNEPGLYIYTEYRGGTWVNMDEAISKIKGERCK